MTNILQATFESTDDGVVTKKCIIVLITYVAQLSFYNLVQAVKTKVYNSKIFILRWSKVLTTHTPTADGIIYILFVSGIVITMSETNKISWGAGITSW